MAIKLLDNNCYYRINYDNCYIKNNKVYISIQQYLNESERQKEKERYDKQQNFIINLQNKIINSYEKDENIWQKYHYIFEDFTKLSYEQPSDISEEDLIILIPLGFEKEWVTNPIRLIGSMIIECGDFDNCEITHKYLYEKLKSKMNNIVDC